MAHILDSVVAGLAAQTDYAKTLGLPSPTGWEPGRVWTAWEVDPALMTPWAAGLGELSIVFIQNPVQIGG
jgi:hypothetical protein